MSVSFFIKFSSYVIRHALLSINNATGWKTRFNEANLTVTQLTDLLKQGVSNERECLAENGLIVYEKGEVRKPFVYQMPSLCEEVSPPTGWMLDENLNTSKNKQDRGE